MTLDFCATAKTAVGMNASGGGEVLVCHCGSLFNFALWGPWEEGQISESKLDGLPCQSVLDESL